MPALPEPRSAALAGAAGAALMAVGDLLMLGVPMGGLDFARAGIGVMAAVPPVRLVAGAALAPVAALLQAVGVLALPSLLERGALRMVATGGLLGLAAVAGAVHLSFGFLGLLVHAGEGAAGVMAWALTLEGLLLVLGAVAGLPGGLALVAAVATGRSALPRAAALASPVVGLPLVYGIGLLLPSPAGGPLVGAAINLSMLLWWSAAWRLAPTGHRR